MKRISSIQLHTAPYSHNSVLSNYPIHVYFLREKIRDAAGSVGCIAAVFPVIRNIIVQKYKYQGAEE